MIVLTRRPGETLVIGADVRIKVMSTSGGAVKLAIDAPRHVPVHREEIFERIAAANLEAAGYAPAHDAGEVRTSGGTEANPGEEWT